MRIAALGCGSIGRRHLRNLHSLGYTDLLAFDPILSVREAVSKELGVQSVGTLEQVWAQAPDVVLITAPSNLHVPLALSAARHGCHLFIEKPLSHSLDGLQALEEEVKRHNLVTMVACNMRFHPGPAKVKQLLEEKVIGRVLFARIHTGSYLPEWRPWQDYRKSYSANKSMGGGCLLDCIHEIDLARWYLGEVEEVFCKLANTGSLEIEVEDVAILICQHVGNVLSEVHLDYVQRTYERGCQIVGEKGSIFWDFNAGTVRCFEAKPNSWTILAQPEEWQVNQMYVDELRHFLQCVRQGKETTLPVRDAVDLMRVVFAASVSGESGRMVAVREELR